MDIYSIGVDTSHPKGQLCLFKNSELLKNVFWEKRGSHSERLNCYFEELLSEFNIEASDINEIFCSIGPGSFTGLRVGINFCKTLSYAHSIPLFPINTLHALSFLCSHDENSILSSIDAQKNSIFISIFTKNNKPLKQNLVIPIEELNSFVSQPYTVCGSGIERYKDFITPDVLTYLSLNESYTSPDLTKIIASHYKNNFLTNISWKDLKPLYIKLSSAEEKLSAARPKS